jgi:molybdopterin-guanine dinucleotide biosynthesis protein A
MPADRIAGVILTGGRSRRMGGGPKALLPLGGKPMLSHVIDRVKPQVSELSLSVEHASGLFELFGLQQLPDLKPDGGPLGGLLAALQWMEPAFDWLLLVPCDAPFVPGDLVDQLHESATVSGLPGALVRYEGEIQPTFSLWHRSLLPVLEHAFTAKGLSGFKQFLREVRLAERDWLPSIPSPFFNINDQEALRKAGQLINRVKENPHAQRE